MTEQERNTVLKTLGVSLRTDIKVSIQVEVPGLGTCNLDEHPMLRQVTATKEIVEEKFRSAVYTEVRSLLLDESSLVWADVGEDEKDLIFQREFERIK